MRLVIIGSGPAGMEAARAAAPYATVTLVSAGAVGAWRHLTSRTWLAATAAGERDVATIAARAAQVVESWQACCAADLAALDVEVLSGRARLVGAGEVLVEDAEGAEQRLAVDAVIIATGAPAAFPEQTGPDGERILSEAELNVLTAVPGSALVVGDGTVGFELCHIFSLLGAEVTWLVPEEAPHSRVTPEVDGYLTRQLERQGVRVVAGASVRRLQPGGSGVTVTMADGSRHGAEVALLSGGRRRNLAAVGLSAELAETDIYGQTKQRGVYLVGDALEPRSASIAMAQGRAAALHAVRRSSGPADTRDMVLTFMQRPQVAKLGKLATEGAHDSVTLALAETVAAHVDNEVEGFLTLAWDQVGRVAGALAVARGAAEILAPVAVAMHAGMRVDELAASYGPHPSISELASLAARKAER